MNRRLSITSAVVLAAVGIALFFSIDRPESRSKKVQNCLAKHGVRLPRGYEAGCMTITTR